MKTIKLFQSHSSLAAGLTMVVAFLTLLAAPSAFAATSTWVGGYPTTGVWSQPTQWAEGVEPAAGNDIIFNNIPGSKIGTSINEPRTVKSITFNGGTPSPAFTIRLANNPGGTAYNLTFQSGNTGITIASTDTAAHTIGVSDGNVVLSGNLLVTHNGSATLTIDRPITGAKNVTKAGTGTLTLSAANTYSGGTTITGGTLKLSGGGKLAAGGISIAGGATFDVSAQTTPTLAASQNLLGTGSVNGNLTTVATTAIYPATDGTDGTLTFNNNLTLNGSTKVQLDLSSTYNGANDQIVLDGIGAVLTPNGAQITIKSDGTLDTGVNDYVLINLTGSGSPSISGSFNAIPAWAGTTPANFNDYSIVATATQVTLHHADVGNPSGVGLATPASVSHGQTPLLTVTVTPGSSPLSTGLAVTADLSSIGGSAAQTFYDDGSNGDVTPADNVFSYNGATVPAGTSLGLKNLVGSITDAESRSAYAIIALTVVAGSETWVASPADANWGTPGNWLSGFSPAAGDFVYFDASSQLSPNLETGYSVNSVTFNSGAGSYTIGGSTLTLTGSGVTNNSANAQALNVPVAMGSSQTINADSGDVTLGGAVSGSGKSLTKAGANTLTLSGMNTYSGNTTISAGTLKLGANDVIPDGTGNGNVTVTGTLDLNSFSDTINGLSGAGTVDNTAASTASTLTVGGNNVSSTFSGVIQNSGSSSTNNLIKTGTGTLTLNAANTLSGTVTVSAGTLALGLDIVNPLPNVTGITLAGGTTLSTTNASVTLVATTPITLGTSGTTSKIAYGRDAAAVGTLTIIGPIGGAANLTFTTPSGASSGGNSQTVILGSANTYGGNTLITTADSGTALTVKANVANALPPTTVLTLDGGNGSGSGRTVTYDLNGHDQTLAGLTNIQLAAQVARPQRMNNSGALATLTVSNSADYTYGIPGLTNTFNSNLIRPTALITGALALTKDGVGKLTLVSANTYTGNTTISNGTLALGSIVTASGTSIGRINSSPNIIVGTDPGSAAIFDVTAAGITIGSAQTLNGHGTVNGSVTVNGTLSPGTSIGTLTLSGNVTLNAGSTNTFEVDGSTPTNDIVALGATVTYGGVLNIVPTGTFTIGQTFTLFSGAGAASASNFDVISVSSGGGLSFTFANGVLTVVTAGFPQPTIAPVTVFGTDLVVSVPTVLGANYVLQSTTNLTPTINWSNESTTAGTGGILILYVPIEPGQPQKFLRLWVY